MRVLVTGATGVLGRATLPVLLGAGVSVSAVVRSVEAADPVGRAGATPVMVDLFDPDAVWATVAGHDAVVHLATAVPSLARSGRRSAWAVHNRLRVDATRNLVDAARDHGVARLVKESVTFLYRDGGEGWIDESAAVDGAPVWRPTRAGERLVEDHSAAGGEGVVLRFGLLYAADARSTAEWRRLARWRIAPVPGPPDAFVSSIRADDAATAILAALTVAPGTYNVVDDRPLRRREHAAAVADAFGVPRLHAVPAPPLRWIGGDGARSLAASHRVSNRAFVTATGWRPRWPDAGAGWADLATPGGAVPS